MVRTDTKLLRNAFKNAENHTELFTGAGVLAPRPCCDLDTLALDHYVAWPHDAKNTELVLLNPKNASKMQINTGVCEPKCQVPGANGLDRPPPRGRGRIATWP